MVKFVVFINVNDIANAFELYQKAFNATQVFADKDPQGNIGHLEMNIQGNYIALTPGNTVAGNVCLNFVFDNENELRIAYEALKDGGQADPLKSCPWSALAASVTDQYGVKWYLML